MRDGNPIWIRSLPQLAMALTVLWCGVLSYGAYRVGHKLLWEAGKAGVIVPPASFRMSRKD